MTAGRVLAMSAKSNNQQIGASGLTCGQQDPSTLTTVDTEFNAHETHRNDSDLAPGISNAKSFLNIEKMPREQRKIPSGTILNTKHIKECESSSYTDLKLSNLEELYNLQNGVLKNYKEEFFTLKNEYMENKHHRSSMKTIRKIGGILRKALVKKDHDIEALSGSLNDLKLQITQCRARDGNGTTFDDIPQDTEEDSYDRCKRFIDDAQDEISWQHLTEIWLENVETLRHSAGKDRLHLGVNGIAVKFSSSSRATTAASTRMSGQRNDGSSRSKSDDNDISSESSSNNDEASYERQFPSSRRSDSGVIRIIKSVKKLIPDKNIKKITPLMLRIHSVNGKTSNTSLPKLKPKSSISRSKSKTSPTISPSNLNETVYDLYHQRQLDSRKQQIELDPKKQKQEVLISSCMKLSQRLPPLLDKSSGMHPHRQSGSNEQIPRDETSDDPFFPHIATNSYEDRIPLHHLDNTEISYFPTISVNHAQAFQDKSFTTNASSLDSTEQVCTSLPDIATKHRLPRNTGTDIKNIVALPDLGQPSVNHCKPFKTVPNFKKLLSTNYLSDNKNNINIEPTGKFTISDASLPTVVNSGQSRVLSTQTDSDANQLENKCKSQPGTTHADTARNFLPKVPQNNSRLEFPVNESNANLQQKYDARKTVRDIRQFSTSEVVTNTKSLSLPTTKKS